MPGWLQTIERYHWATDEVRSYDRVPFKLVIVDRTVAILPFSRDTDGSSSIAIVRGSTLLDALIALFEQVWSVATPLLIGSESSPADSPLSAEDGRLLSLMLAGLTDEAIAARQSVSTRTVQRRVQALMSAAHARTRLQLAWHAGRSGWLV
jgi:DNA-binding CsgD family transcriptional regulator